MNKIGYLIQDLIKNQRVIYFLKEFEQSLKLSPDELKAYQFRKLKNLLVHAGDKVEFYKKRFAECGFNPEKFTSFDQIKEIPVLTREDLQKNCSTIIAQGYKTNKLYFGSSSGSTGQPVFYYKDNIAESAGQAAHLTGWSLSGWKMNLKGLHIWGNPDTVNNEWSRFSSKLKAKIFRHHKFPAYKLTEGSQFFDLYRKIKANKYDYLDGYTNAIYLLAVLMKDNNLSLDHNIKYVFTTAENLHDFQRDVINEKLGPVYDGYGCGEINGIAYECSECSFYHIIDPHVFVEFGSKTDNSGLYELLITDLDNYAFPLIRYKNDDLGIPSKDIQSDCVYKFSKLESIAGRESDIIKFKDGGVLSVPSFFGSMLLKKVKGIKQYQVELVGSDLINVNLVKSEIFSNEDLIIIQNALRTYLENKIRYNINFVNKIQPDKNGKIKLVVDKTKQKNLHLNK
ncbi:MAG TPA: hypothetical protein PLQ61_09915 [Bacteroidales bacterium]|nr:phenylacetate--CoA ligase family protein [Bacteroidales bacterium]HQJ21491.1 hypothetical protein [Bacteroidales bacterium]